MDPATTDSGVNDIDSITRSGMGSGTETTSRLPPATIALLPSVGSRTPDKSSAIAPTKYEPPEIEEGMTRSVTPVDPSLGDSPATERVPSKMSEDEIAELLDR